MTLIYSPHSSFDSHTTPLDGPQWNWITLSGPDAGDFLHRLTTVNVKALDLGKGAQGCFLTPQGRMKAYFTLWHYGDQDFAFEFDGGQNGAWKASLFDIIDQYTFGEKMTLTDVHETLHCLWIFPTLPIEDAIGGITLESGSTSALSSEVRLCHHGDADYGRTWITAWGRPDQLEKWASETFPEAKPVSPSLLERWRIQSTTPKVNNEITETTLPLEVGLRHAIADHKGCYPGQEVIERIVALGSPPRRLIQIEGTGPLPSLNSPIWNLADPPIEIGQLTSVTSDSEADLAASSDTKGESFHALGIVKKIHAKEGMGVKLASPQEKEGEKRIATITRVAPYA